MAIYDIETTRTSLHSLSRLLSHLEDLDSVLARQRQTRMMVVAKKAC